MVSLCSSSSPVSAADPSGNGGVPEEAGRVLRGSEAVSAERVHSEGVFPVSLPAAPHPFSYYLYNISRVMCCRFLRLRLLRIASLPRSHDHIFYIFCTMWSFVDLPRVQTSKRPPPQAVKTTSWSGDHCPAVICWFSGIWSNRNGADTFEEGSVPLSVPSNPPV